MNETSNGVLVNEKDLYKLIEELIKVHLTLVLFM